MGFLKKLFKGDRNKVLIDNDKDIVVNTIEDTSNDLSVQESKKGKETIEESCEQVLDSMRSLEELKMEYHAVTAYLTDIQKIDAILTEEREDINEYARKIITLTREKANYQSRSKKISDSAYKLIASYEESLPKDLERMKENEVYQSKIEKDLKYLEGEKASLFYQKEDVLNSEKTIKKIGMISSILTVLLFLVFIVIELNLEISTKIPFLMTVAMAFIIAVYIIIETGKNKKEVKLLQAKQNRAIYLSNKVKIKYINNTNALDYSYQKFRVKSYSELQYLWDQYKKVKEEEIRNEKNTDLLERANRELVRMLRKYQLEDPGIWVYQAVALIDNKEMVEVRHRLNVRRQKLRESMDYNNKLKEEGIEKIVKYLSDKPAEKEKVEPLLKKHGIYV